MIERDRLLAFALIGLSLGISLAGSARAAAGAAELYQANCLRCHDSGIYTREDRRITSYDGLERQVQRCELALGLTWFDEDITGVAEYLNRHYYHLPR